jgi:D-serine deaminase-like pyridoxal phosphate-dependent protein
VTADATFTRLAQILRRRDLGRPQVVIDVGALQRNVDRVAATLGARGLRLAVKSLPCPGLIDLVLQRAHTSHLMAFDVPTLCQCLERWPRADVLLGKPLPAAALQRVLESWTARPIPRPQQRVHWLVDTPQRVTQYAELAKTHGTTVGVCIELDVGMHRGGVAGDTQLDALLEVVAAAGPLLELRGFMGYDAHAARAPWPRTPSRAAAAVAGRYAALVARARARYPTLVPPAPILNGAGSPTYALLPRDAPLNEVALGSVLVKPSDFDLPQLADIEPAAWIATPVLKDLAGVRLPFLEWAAPLLGRGRRTLFLHGGRWLARPEWPRGMRESPLYGLSSNQQFMSVPSAAPVAVDDYVFFRPTQSEAVLGQFGFLTAVFADERVEHWPAFTPVEPGLDD